MSTPTVTPTPTGPPAKCLDTPPTFSPGPSSLGAAVVTGAKAADLPSDVALAPGVQVISSTKRPGTYEAVVRVCSEPLDRAELIAIANVIAVSITRAAGGSDGLSVLVVSAWHPDGQYLGQGESVRTQFSTFTWDPSGPPLDRHWE